MQDYFKWKKVWIFTPIFQVLLIIIAFIFIAILGKYSIDNTGLLFAKPSSFYLETLFAPIYEELLFRGVVLSSLLKHYSPLKAILYSSLLFGLWHLKNLFFVDTNVLITQMLYTAFLFGPVMGYIAYRTKTIWITSVLHYFNNAFAFIMICSASI